MLRYLSRRRGLRKEEVLGGARQEKESQKNLGGKTMEGTRKLLAISEKEENRMPKEVQENLRNRKKKSWCVNSSSN